MIQRVGNLDSKLRRKVRIERIF